MSQIDKWIFIETICLISIFILIAFFVLKEEKQRPRINKRKKRKSVYLNFSIKEIIFIVSSSLFLTYLLTKFTKNIFTSSSVFLILIICLPYSLVSNTKRMKAEDLFDDVITYCQNVGLLLRQSHNVFESLYKVETDISSSDLKSDIGTLRLSFEYGYDATRKVMEEFENKYPYSCVKSLDSIMLHMFYENSNINNDLLNAFQDDCLELSNSVKRNQKKRSSLRIQYIGINVGCFLVYFVFIDSLKDSFGSQFMSTSFQIVNTIFIALMLISLFFVDQYFNNNITKE